MQNFVELEEKILKYWEKNKSFEKSVKNRSKARAFVFYEGPPTANARPGIHHVLARSFKDLFCRYKTMQGYRVERRAGWDTHGLPVELQIEKKLGFKNKQDIENYGIAKFNKQCKKAVWEFKEDWENLTKRIGFWLDFKNAYITYENKYIKQVWKILKQIWDKNLLIQDYKVVPWCSRCGTALSSHEVAQGYKKTTEKSVYLKFKVKNQKNTYLLAWTTTPWTLPGNVALAVGEKINYILIKKKSEYYILAEARKDILKNCKIIKKLKTKDLIGLEYEPLFDIPEFKKNKKAFKVYPADFVNTEEGTGIVHTAVMYGEDDYILGSKISLPKIHTVDENGKFNKLVKNFENLYVKSQKTTDKLIKYLQDKKFLFAQENYEHDYPYCWRCDSPLLYYAKQSWFIKMTKLQKELIANNQKINWHPEYLKKGRFGEWLKDIKDWALSRERYWGTPLPIWQCKKCDKQKLEIRNFKIRNLHRPFIDKIVFNCKCGGKMHRVPDVIDVWFDSGAMPYASKTQGFPADFICEAIDQTRGWFYTLLAISTCMRHGPSYKNVLSLGHVLDKHGKKMSKSKGNTVWPEEIINKFGVDSLRWYFFSVNQAGEPKKFDIQDIQEKQRKIISTLHNSFVFLKDYAQDDRKSKNILDFWIISRLNQTIKYTTRYLNNYDAFRASRVIEKFIDDLSNWYIRRTRKDCNKKLLQQILEKLSLIMAPFTPFITEYILPDVHLKNWPKSGKIDIKLNNQMQKIREICADALALRAKAGIKVRQPLNKLSINSKQLSEELQEIIKQEVNIKKIVFGKSLKLDTKITPKLKAEGQERELIREIQDLRKKAGLKIQDKIILTYPKPVSDFVKNSVGAEKIKKGALAIDKI